jgi:hypothetical protein
MALQQEQDLLARLYTDPDIRKQFLSKPASFAAESGLSHEDADALARAAGYEVNWFADSLVNKRLREVRKLLSLTEQEIGATEFERRFREFAAGFSPTSVKKHLGDALAFSDVLCGDDAVERPVKDVTRFESRRLRHGAFGRRISFCLLRHDPRRAGLDDASEMRRGFGVWIAVVGWSRIFFRASMERSQT